MTAAALCLALGLPSAQSTQAGFLMRFVTVADQRMTVRCYPRCAGGRGRPRSNVGALSTEDFYLRRHTVMSVSVVSAQKSVAW